MFVVTFYSYKGGVGRTMALVNIAVAEAKLGKRVLVVDFDLEAPGLPSYKSFEDSGCDRGIVDYITAYRTTGTAPNAAEFITECNVGGSPIWLMPAGRHTRPGYTDTLNAIDWQNLYERQEGYLMFEDLKRQWQAQGFDYVLIDSRTGHTDVGGICTRQLPDAVVIMFLPNKQNIEGLVPIVAGIRAERSRKKKIKLRFCASNVPDLDDENDILVNALADARDRLDYSEDDLNIVKHYSSLEVLTQVAFVQSRQNSRLAKEYQRLRKSIISLNPEDREGALAALHEMPERIKLARSQQQSEDPAALCSKIEQIRLLHPSDGEIAFSAALILGQLGEQQAEVEALSVAIEQGYEVNQARIARAYRSSIKENREEAIDDLRQVLASTTASLFELVPAFQFLYSLEGKWTTGLEKVLDRPDTEFATLRYIAPLVMGIRKGLPAVARRMQQSAASAELDAVQRRVALNFAVLSHIGSGQFGAAKTLIRAQGEAPLEQTELEDLFNFAMADWGDRTHPSTDLFAEVAHRVLNSDAKQFETANALQCAAVAASVAGDRDAAMRSLDLAGKLTPPGRMIFSCWQFLYVTSDELLSEIEAMKQLLLRGDALTPPFLDEVRRLVH